MSKQFVLILWIIAGALAALTIALKSAQSKTGVNPTNLAAGEKLLANLKPGDIASIKIEGADETTTLLKGEDDWTIAERENYSANFDRLFQLMQQMTSLTVAQNLKAGSAFNERFGMNTQAEAQENHGYQITFADTSGSELASLTLGKSTSSNSPSNPMTRGTNGKYLRLGSEPNAIYIVNQSFNNLDSSPSSWLNEDFIKISKIKSIDLATPNENDFEGWTLTRTDESADFIVPNIPAGRQIDPNKTNALKNLLSFARFTDVLTKEQAAEKSDTSKARQLVIETFDNFRYLIDYAPRKRSAEDTNQAEEFIVTIKVTANLPAEREQKEGETEEEAKAADKTFAELKEKLAREQNYANYTYTLSNWTLDAA
ncbi:MAG: DUF4340 domain-containing protein, partial [Verrucomicrobiota bacterium]